MTKSKQKQSVEAVAERRAAIMQAAFEVFVEKGFAAATTLEIVRRAKTSKRALYELFASKQEILTALIRHGSQRMQAPPDLPPPSSRAEFIATLEQFGRAFLTEFLNPERLAMYRLAIAERGRDGGTVARELEAGGRLPVAASAARYFEQAAARGLLPGDDITLLLPVFFSVLIGLAPLQLLLGAEPVTADVIAERAARAAATLRRLLPAD